ncbi:MAG: polysaccharide pyruvyl transferase family protein [Planctomycetota bacterium]
MNSQTSQKAQDLAESSLAEARSVERCITLIDTSVVANNIGDSIIMDAVRHELADLFTTVRTLTVASHERMTRLSRANLRDSDYAIIGGTNCLSSRMWFRCTWKLSPIDALRVRNVVLMGCGWYQYQRKPDPYSRWLLRKILSKEHVHSVRDSYTKEMLNSIGIENVENTGCPTLWQLDEDHCRNIPVQKAGRVLTSLNTFFPNEKLDAALLNSLRQQYSEVYFWIQNPADYAYAKRLDPNLICLNPTLPALDGFLANTGDLDYVGNRLHAGIRALQHRVRSLIVEVDNRAAVMGKDWGLPTVARDGFDQIEDWIKGSKQVELRLPRSQIEDWKRQFYA